MHLRTAIPIFLLRHHYDMSSAKGEIVSRKECVRIAEKRRLYDRRSSARTRQSNSTFSLYRKISQAKASPLSIKAAFSCARDINFFI